MKIDKIMGWTIPCDCCGITINKIKNESYGYDSYNLDDTPHEKHFKVWVSAVASFSYYPNSYDNLDPKSKVGDLTIEELERQLEFKLNLKFGQYFHGQSGYTEIWIKPRKIIHNDIDYYVQGNIDGEKDGCLIELKTTWVSSKTKMQGIVERAKIQADIYSWVGDYKEAKIIIKNLAKPELDLEIPYIPNPDDVEKNIITYIEENSTQIKKY